MTGQRASATPTRSTDENERVLRFQPLCPTLAGVTEWSRQISAEARMSEEQAARATRGDGARRLRRLNTKPAAEKHDPAPCPLVPTTLLKMRGITTQAKHHTYNARSSLYMPLARSPREQRQQHARPC